MATSLVDQLPWVLLLTAGVALALAPFAPEPVRRPPSVPAAHSPPAACSIWSRSFACFARSGEASVERAC